MLDKYKNKKCKTLIGKIFQRLVFHNLTRLLFFSILLIVGGIFTNFSSNNAWFYMFMIGVCYCVISGIIFVCFGIINTFKK